MGKQMSVVLRGGRALFPLLLALFLWGCCSSDIYVAIPPKDFRSADQPSLLPLSAGARTMLMKFLRAGADWANEPDIVDLGAGKYDSLLALLADTAYLKAEVLEEDAPFRKWFSTCPVYGVIDAREETVTLLDRPIAYLTDGKYWWVFYREDRRLTHLLVAKQLMREAEKGR